MLHAARKAVSVLRNLRLFGSSYLASCIGGSPERVIALRLGDRGPVFVRAGNSDIDVVRDVFGGKVYDLSYPAELANRVQARCAELLAAGEVPVIVDAGANIGAASIWFAYAFPRTHIVAIEPDADNAELLHRNLDHRPNCTISSAAIGSESGFVDVINGDADGQGWAKQTTRASSGIPIITVADAVALVPNGKLFLAKVDIEGFEADLFADNLDWLDDAEVVIIEPHDWMKPGEGTSLSFQRAMASRSFELYIAGENLIYARIGRKQQQAA